MNWFAIGGGLAVALSGAIALLRRSGGQPGSLPPATAWVLMALGLVFAGLGAAPAFTD